MRMLMVRDSAGLASWDMQGCAAGGCGWALGQQAGDRALSLLGHPGPQTLPPALLLGKLLGTWSHRAGEDIMLKTCYFWMEFATPLCSCDVKHGCLLGLTEP